MKAVVKLDVPDWQIGQEVSVFFPDSMVAHGVAEKDEESACIGRCINCKHCKQDVSLGADGVSYVITHDNCLKWNHKTIENGYCHLFEAKETN